MTDDAEERISSGIDGFDTVLSGGFIPNRAYMVTGRPGTGKTILGLHYLTAGAADES
jgi:circadian clock protein KaiC